MSFEGAPSASKQGPRREADDANVARIAILGLGNRGGSVYADYVARHGERARVVAVADPMPHLLHDIAARHGLPPSACFDDFRDLVAQLPSLGVDAVIVALPDSDHVEAMEMLVPHGLPILVEKPLAPTETSLRRLADVARQATAPISVAHVLRFTPFFRAVHAVLSSGALGQLRTLRLEENVGFWHFAHSYVRGNWRRRDESSPMILAKSCHDLDALRWLAAAEPRVVASIGSLVHFRPENAPEGAPDRCLDGCPAADECPFYAPRFYVEALADVHSPPVSLLGADLSTEGRLRALATGQFGRCVYHCDNDVADHQQVLVEFDNDVTAALTVSAFTSANTRTIQATCSMGELMGRMDTGELEVHLYSPTAGDLTGLPAEAVLRRERRAGPMAHRVLEFSVRAAGLEDQFDDRGHGGGDEALMDRFIGSLLSPSPETLETTFEASLDSHWMAFAAERSRLAGRAVHLPSAAETSRAFDQI